MQVPGTLKAFYFKKNKKTIVTNLDIVNIVNYVIFNVTSTLQISILCLVQVLLSGSYWLHF